MIFWRKAPVVARTAGLLADPYYEWALATRFVYYGNAEWLPVLIELKKDTAQSFAELVIRGGDSDPWTSNIRVPSFYATPPKRLQRKPTRFLAVLARKQLLADIYAGNSPADHIRRFEVGRAMQSLLAMPTPPPSTTSPPASAPPCVVSGVIDDGIAFAHDRFWASNRGTRVEYFWEQHSVDWNADGELTKADINAYMVNSSYLGQVDEDELYRRAGSTGQTRAGHKPLAARASHGAHVMDLACHAADDELPRPPAPDAWPIVAVQLPVATVKDTSGAKLTPQVIAGLCYILERAQTIASDAGVADLPVVVNVSYGLIAGPHDGSNLLEAAIDDLVGGCTPPIRVVLPAGNNLLSRCHAGLSIGASQSKTLTWRVLPDDWTESHIEIWLPEDTDVDKVTIMVIAPDGTASGAFVAGVTHELVSGAAVVGQAAYFAAGGASVRASVRLSLAPTSSPDGDKPTAPAGRWRIRIANLATAPLCDVHAWIQRDDTAPGYSRSGRQSYFDDPGYQRYDDGGRAIEVDNAASDVKRTCTLNAIATGKEPIVVGGFRRSDNKPAPYSAAGPLQYPGYAGRGMPNPNGPEAMFPSEDAPSLRGVLGAGTRSSSCIPMYGTSVSAPLAARFVAARMPTSAQDDRGAVFNEGNVRGPVSPADRPRGGGGRVDMPSTRRPRRES